MRTGSHPSAVWVWPVASHVLPSAAAVDDQSSCCDNHLILVLRKRGSGKTGLFLHEKWALNGASPNHYFSRGAGSRC